jgi:3-methyl-2-oxobutanoate hydroxymethyltransferase
VRTNVLHFQDSHVILSLLLARKKVTIQHLHQLRKAGTPITMLTAYDFPTGRACETHNVDITLVGDSLAQVCLGYDSTTRLTLDEMLHHCRAVARGSKSPFLVADMPFGTYHTSIDDAVRNATRLVSEGGVEGVKIEGAKEVLDVVRRLTSVGIPVMAHVGLMPQRHTMFSGYKVQGRDAHSAAAILESALALEEAGAFAIVLEAIPHRLGSYITTRLRRAPTIGIGAGSQTSGQVLVWDDMLGTWSGHKAKFVRRFGDVRSEIERGVKGYTDEVRARTFPSLHESYDMPSEEWDRFLQLVDAEA